MQAQAGEACPGEGGGPGDGVGLHPGQRSGSCSAPTEVGQGTACRAEPGRDGRGRAALMPASGSGFDDSQ